MSIERFPISHRQNFAWLTVLILLVLVPSMLPVAWAIDSEAMNDPELQARYVTISKELRCLVCQNQSIQDSNAELAKDLRRQVRGMLEAGQSDDEIYAYMTERYGDYVRYRPPWRLNTMLLQLGPVFIAVLGVWMLWGTLRRHRSRGDASVIEQQRPEDIEKTAPSPPVDRN